MRQIDTKTFETYIDTYKSLVYTICLSFVKNPYDAEDLAQEAFVSAYKSFAKFDPKNPKSWFATIAANKCRDFLKNPARRVVTVDNDDLAYIRDKDASVEEQVEQAAAEERAAQLCSQLKEPYRSVAVAYYCHDETITEISARTGDNRKTIATRLYRAKEMLKKLVKEDAV